MNIYNSGDKALVSWTSLCQRYWFLLLELLDVTSKQDK